MVLTIGVPLRTHRDFERRLEAATADLVDGFRMVWLSSRTTPAQFIENSPSLRGIFAGILVPREDIRY